MSPILYHYYILESKAISFVQPVQFQGVIASDFAAMGRAALKLALVSSSVQKCEQIKAELGPHFGSYCGVGQSYKY